MATTVRWLSGITMVLVLIQAALIGQGLYLGDPSRTALHGLIGNVTFVGALVLAGLVAINHSSLSPQHRRHGAHATVPRVRDSER